MFPRNAPCPCASGKKFKKCCDGTVTINAAAVLRRESTHPGFIAATLQWIDAELARRNHPLDATMAPPIPQPTTHGATQP
jgi:hypothetical protein